MANRWASGLLMGMGVVGLCPMAQAQGVPNEPMPMNVAPGGYQNSPMPLFGTGYGPQVPTMAPGMGGMPGPGMGMPGGMPGMPPGPMMPMSDGPGMPMAPSMNHGQVGPNGMPGVGLPMGATYYPGISGENRSSIWDKLFLCEDGERRRIYAKVGYFALKRQGLADTPLISVEPEELNTDGDGDSTFGLTPFVGSFKDVNGDLQNGLQAFIGLQDDCHGFLWEIGGFYIANKTSSFSRTLLGRLDSPYTNAPIGFQDTAGLWTNADFMNLRYKNTLYSGEMNWRFFGDCWKTLDVNYLIGLRYIKLQDSLRHYTIDDDLQLGINDPTTRAALEWRGENDMFGLQIGWGLTQRLTQTWAISWDQKIALLANAAQTQQSLVRDDGLVGFKTSETSWRFAQAYEGGLFLDMNAGNMRLRAGYQLNLYVGVATAENQFNYDLELTPSVRKTADTVFYHGPSISVEFVF
jgi:hypothetical protein